MAALSLDATTKDFWFSFIIMSFKMVALCLDAVMEGNHSHLAFLDTPLHVDVMTNWSKLPWRQVSKVTVVQKQPSFQPSRLIVSSFGQHESCTLRLKCDGTRAETRFRLSGETDQSI